MHLIFRAAAQKGCSILIGLSKPTTDSLSLEEPVQEVFFAQPGRRWQISMVMRTAFSNGGTHEDTYEPSISFSDKSYGALPASHQAACFLP